MLLYNYIKQLKMSVLEVFFQYIIKIIRVAMMRKRPPTIFLDTLVAKKLIYINTIAVHFECSISYLVFRPSELKILNLNLLENTFPRCINLCYKNLFF